MPFAATALVPAYHISSLNNSESLLLDGETLALIFMGNISSWDHPNIQMLNPTLKLPHANITVAVSPSQTALAQTDVFKKALSLFSEDFARELAEAGDDLANMRLAMEGTAFIAADHTARLQYLQVNQLKIA